MKIPVGVSLPGLPLEMVAAATRVSAAIEIGHLVAEADDEALGAGARRDVAPHIFAGREQGVAERFLHVVTGLGRGIARFGAGFVGFHCCGGKRR